MTKRYKNYGFRLKEQTLELLKKLKSENGKSWNLFIYEMAVEYTNSNKQTYRPIFTDEYQKHRKDKCEQCGIELEYKRVGHYSKPNLIPHHIDGDITNNNPENIKTLCTSCHAKEYPR